VPYAHPGRLIAAVDDGLVACGPEANIEVGIDAPRSARLGLLSALTGSEVTPTAIAEEADTEIEDAVALIERLLDHEILVQSPAGIEPPEGESLVEAVLAAAQDKPVASRVWTAEELLVLPEDADATLARRAVRAFVAGMLDQTRLRAYAYVANWLEATAWGDRPPPEQAAAALDLAAGLDPNAVHVIQLHQGKVDTIAADRAGVVGAGESHRLGTVVLEIVSQLDYGPRVCSARFAIPNLRNPGGEEGRVSRGVAEEESLARLIARAEAAERYAAGDAGAHDLVRARERDLEGAVSTDQTYLRNRRQLAEPGATAEPDPDDPILWVRASTASGETRWLPAELVFFPFDDPDVLRPMLPHVNSSGVAAHSTREAAIARALAELAERDAFMWTWVQRLSRERIDERTLPEDTRSLAAAVRGLGFEVHLVNITLDVLPVILCVALSDGWIVPGAAAGRDPTAAATKALTEAAVITSISTEAQPQGPPIAAEEVATPAEHMRFHHDAGLAEEDAFLFSNDERIALDEIGASGAAEVDAARAVGEPLFVELTTPATQPFSVVRAVVPGMIPITFGFDTEPLGLPRLAEPRVTLDGRHVGRTLDLSNAGPLVPHPFA
jgi:ribosomal protein S12 methylthiotransferase accessory factor